MFKNEFFKQIDRVAMVSPLDPALANTFMCSFENKWLKYCPHGLKPVFYSRYVDNILVWFLLSIMQKSLKSIYLLNIPT